jgi:hypothetical protein
MVKNNNQAVDCLHQVARYVEHHFGAIEISKNIRESADKLHELAKTKVKE